jgi:transposase
VTGTAEAKKVCDQFPGVSHLSDLDNREGLVGELLRVMRDLAAAPSPGVLGLLGKDNLKARFEQWYGVRRWWYHKETGEANGIPFVFETAVAETERPGRLFHGVNYSPTFDDPLASTCLACGEFTTYGVEGFLVRGHVLCEAGEGPRNRAAAVHLVWPAPEFLDKGKTRLKVSDVIAEAVAAALWKVVKELYKEEERRKKDAARADVDDAAAAPAALTQLAGQPLGKVRLVYADSKYHNHTRYGWVAENGWYDLEIVRRPKGQKGWVKLPIRWTVERTFAWLHKCRRLSVDREKSTRSAEAMIRVAMIHRMLNRLCPKEGQAEFRYRKAA